VVTFELNQNWNRLLDVSAYTSINEAILGLCVSFYYNTEINGTLQEIPISIFSTVNLPKNYYESYDSLNLELPKIKIKWGCFAKNTKIMLADGSEKEITMINKEDYILGENGTALQVTGIVSGMEEKIINICTTTGRKLGVTESHPIKTNRGILRAKDVMVEDLVSCISGEEEVEFTYFSEYQDEVYSLCTDGGSQLIVANGIWAGNLDMQNDPAVLTKKKPLLEEKVIETAKQFKELLKYMEEQENNHMEGDL
jgi:hypothetical protein